MPIKKLPDLLINQIAAGEVVENPASVIKELVENSLDAGADFIQIQIKAGGYQLIEIIDNGSGIPKDEILLAFERHATSKLSTLSDLETHEKMGFRGEALASIASCSLVTLKTATHDGEGVEVHLKGGVAQSIDSISFKKGTSLEVRDLFFNTPARKKFQKSATSSLIDIERELTALMLAHPKVSFIFKADKNRTTEVYADTSINFEEALKKRIYTLFDKIPVEKGRFLKMHDPLLSIYGYLAPLDHHHAHRRHQYFIVNNRPVDAFGLKSALNEALKSYLPEKRFCSGVFHIQIDPKWVDINIHPQKKEVRFAEEGYLKDQINRLLTPQIKENPKIFSSPIPFMEYKIPEKTLTPAYVQQEAYKAPLWIKTVGYYPPFLLIDASEIPDFPFKSGLVLFHVKEASKQLAQIQFFEKRAPLPSQGLLIPYPLDLFSNKAGLSVYYPLFKELGFEISQTLELMAHPPKLDLETAKEILLTLIQKTEEGASHDEIIHTFFSLFYEKLSINYEDAMKGLSQVLEKPFDETASYFARISDEKLKEIFYVARPC